MLKKIQFESLLSDEPGVITINLEDNSAESDGSAEGDSALRMFTDDFDSNAKKFYEYFRDWQGGYTVSREVD